VGLGLGRLLCAIPLSWALPFLVAASFAVIAFAIYYFFVLPQPLSLETEAPDAMGIERVATETGAHE
jgi:hypothetical protein